MNDKRLNDLFGRRLKGKISPAENEELKQLMADISHEAQVNDLLSKTWKEFDSEAEHFEPHLADRLLSNIWAKIRAEAPQIRLWPRIAGVASILFILSFSGYMYFHFQKTHENTNKLASDARPGVNGATLTLSNGGILSLGHTRIGQIANQNGVSIKKATGGLLVYKNEHQDKISQVSYNELQTANGQQFAVVLPDGTKVWLNAASSLRYPVVFDKKARVVELQGEGYFEVVHNSKWPFKIIAANQLIEDIGTEFNINTYNNEPDSKITLVNGIIKVIKGNSSEILKPGQQVTSHNDNNNLIVSTADVESAISWKNGLFHFNHASVDAVMRQIARWYDLEIVYQTSIPSTVISGEAYRDMNASQLFQLLDGLKLNFKIEGKKLIIYNKNTK